MDLSARVASTVRLVHSSIPRDVTLTHEAGAAPLVDGVSDTGVGIPGDMLSRIFDPLFSTKSAGTGLGLAVVSRVAQQHDGLIHCESTVGAGTTFELYFPVAAA